MRPCLTWITWVGKVIRTRKSKVGEIHTCIYMYILNSTRILLEHLGSQPKPCSQPKRIPLQASLSWFMTNLFCGTKKKERKPSTSTNAIRAEGLPFRPHGVSGVQATSAFHLRGLHRQAPFDPQFEDLTKKTHRNPILMISYSIFFWWS